MAEEVVNDALLNCILCREEVVIDDAMLPVPAADRCICLRCWRRVTSDPPTGAEDLAHAFDLIAEIEAEEAEAADRARWPFRRPAPMRRVS